MDASRFYSFSSWFSWITTCEKKNPFCERESHHELNILKYSIYDQVFISIFWEERAPSLNVDILINLAFRLNKTASNRWIHQVCHRPKKKIVVQKWPNLQEGCALIWPWFFFVRLSFWDMVDFMYSRFCKHLLHTDGDRLSEKWCNRPYFQNLEVAQKKKKDNC